LIPDRRVALRRAVCCSHEPPNIGRRFTGMRHIGVDLHKTNFVACFIETDDTTRTETFPLTGSVLELFKQ
jgi:hypothetical protein